MKVLLHTCCGPCLIYPYEKLGEKNYEVDCFFFNPNIHPYVEYLRRLDTLVSFSQEKAISLKIPDYQPEIYFRAVAFHEKKGERCELCYQIRLKESARRAKEEGYDLFTSTLLVSRYQDHDKIKKIGEELSKAEGIPFFYYDFREGYYQGVNQSREMGMYRQKYCGCIFSEIERVKKKSK